VRFTTGFNLTFVAAFTAGCFCRNAFTFSFWDLLLLGRDLRAEPLAVRARAALFAAVLARAADFAFEPDDATAFTALLDFAM
jgi:hypothetical protein